MVLIHFGYLHLDCGLIYLHFDWIFHVWNHCSEARLVVCQQCFSCRKISFQSPAIFVHFFDSQQRFVDSQSNSSNCMLQSLSRLVAWRVGQCICAQLRSLHADRDAIASSADTTFGLCCSTSVWMFRALGCGPIHQHCNARLWVWKAACFLSIFASAHALLRTDWYGCTEFSCSVIFLWRICPLIPLISDVWFLPVSWLFPSMISPYYAMVLCGFLFSNLCFIGGSLVLFSYVSLFDISSIWGFVSKAKTSTPLPSYSDSHWCGCVLIESLSGWAKRFWTIPSWLIAPASCSAWLLLPSSCQQCASMLYLDSIFTCVCTWNIVSAKHKHTHHELTYNHFLLSHLRYTESFFSFFAFLGLLCFVRERYAAAAMCFALTCAIRSNGSMLISYFVFAALHALFSTELTLGKVWL